MKLSFALCALPPLAGFGCSDDGADDNGLAAPTSAARLLPCGGDVVGNWTIAGACVDPDAITNDDVESVKDPCPTLTYKTSYQASGSASFTSTNYIFAIQQTVTATIDVPASCLTAFGLSCSDLNGILQHDDRQRGRRPDDQLLGLERLHLHPVSPGEHGRERDLHEGRAPRCTRRPGATTTADASPSASMARPCT